MTPSCRKLSLAKRKIGILLLYRKRRILRKKSNQLAMVKKRPRQTRGISIKVVYKTQNKLKFAVSRRTKFKKWRRILKMATGHPQSLRRGLGGA